MLKVANCYQLRGERSRVCGEVLYPFGCNDMNRMAFFNSNSKIQG